MIFNQISKSMGWPFTLAYLALVLSAFYFSFVTMPRAVNSNDWPQAQGKVVNSELVQRSRMHRSGKRVTVYSAKVNYIYHVDGKPFASHQLKWADRNGPAQVEADMLSQYPAGANVTVFYNPGNPSEAVLQKGISLDHILIGMFLLGSILAMAFAMFRNARRRRSV